MGFVMTGGGVGTDEKRRETGENRGRRRKIMPGEKGGVTAREKGDKKNRSL